MRYFTKSEAFARDYLRVHKVTVQVQEPIPYVELRRMKNGIEFYIDRLHETILVRFPGMEDWIDFGDVKRLGSTEVMQSLILSTLPESRLLEVNKSLKVKNRGAE